MELLSFLRDVILPMLITLIGGIFVLVLAKRGPRFQWTVLIVMTIGVGAVLWYQWSRTPRMVVVPALFHEFADPAVDLCNRVGLKPVVKEGNYGGRSGEVVRQSLYPGSQVFVGREIELTVYRGSPVGEDTLDGRTIQNSK